MIRRAPLPHPAPKEGPLMRRIVHASLAALAAVVLVLGASAPGAAQSKVKVGALKLTSSAPIFM